MVDTLFVYYRHKPGGLCKRLYRAIDACAERGDKVTFVTLDTPPVTFHPNVSVWRIPFFTRRRDGLYFWGAFTLYLPVVLLLISLKYAPKRIIAFGPYYAAVSLPCQFLLGRRVYLFLRSLTFKIDKIKGRPRWLRGITGAVDFVGIKTASRVIAMTLVMRAEASEFACRPLEMFPVLPNDVPQQIGKVNSRMTDGGQFLFAGVLDQRKNIEVLIRAWRLLEAEGGPQLLLHIVGDGPDRSKLESLCVSLGVKGVVFHGWQSSLATFFERTSLYLHPSAHEGISNSLLEALGEGVAVLASDIPEHREIFNAGTPLLNLVSPERPEDWASLVKMYLSDFTFKQQVEEVCCRSSRKFRFDWEGKFFDITRF